MRLLHVHDDRNSGIYSPEQFYNVSVVIQELDFFGFFPCHERVICKVCVVDAKEVIGQMFCIMAQLS